MSTADLTAIDIQNFEQLATQSNSLYTVSQSAIDDFKFIYGSGGTQRFQTAEATLNLSNKYISSIEGFASTNASGTTFTVNDANNGFFVLGGPGIDILVGTGFAFTQFQRIRSSTSGRSK